VQLTSSSCKRLWLWVLQDTCGSSSALKLHTHCTQAQRRFHIVNPGAVDTAIGNAHTGACYAIANTLVAIRRYLAFHRNQAYASMDHAAIHVPNCPGKPALVILGCASRLSFLDLGVRCHSQPVDDNANLSSPNNRAHARSQCIACAVAAKPAKSTSSFGATFLLERARICSPQQLRTRPSKHPLCTAYIARCLEQHAGSVNFCKLAALEARLDPLRLAGSLATDNRHTAGTQLWSQLSSPCVRRESKLVRFSCLRNRHQAPE
jgi:hypothetical protein